MAAILDQKNYLEELNRHLKYVNILIAIITKYSILIVTLFPMFSISYNRTVSCDFFCSINLN